MKLDLEAARKELGEKSQTQIEEETAAKWAARAIVCYEKYIEFGVGDMMNRGDTNYHEALEHAALADDPMILVAEVKAEVDKIRNQCFNKP